MQIEKVGVLGCGLMGSGIAQVSATAGFPVTIVEVTQELCERGLRNIEKNLDRQVEKGPITSERRAEIRGRLSATTDLGAVADCDLIIEAIIENRQEKLDIFRRLDGIARREAILASNTSSFPMTEISRLMQRPERAVVTHWSNPPYYVPLVEVVPGKKTSEETTQTAYDLLLKVKKVPVRLKKEIIGFILNRVQVAMNREVYYLVEQGVVSPEDMDKAMMTSLGFRLPFQGPLQVRDLAGLEVTLKVDEVLLGEINSSTEPSKLLREKVARGEVGAKSGKGFFEYTPESLAKVIQERDRHFISLLKELYLK